MSDAHLIPEMEEEMARAVSAMERIHQRLEAGEAVDEQEMTDLAKTVALCIEDVRTKLEQVVGPIDPERFKEQMKQKLSPEEYAEWLAGEESRKGLTKEVEG